jgi:hypothetical protein
MEKITIHNYEAFLLDFMEGRLDPDQQRMLMHFLKEHPELAPNDLAPVPGLHQDINEYRYASKGKLLKHHPRFSVINEETADAAMIAWWEGDLSESEKEVLQQYIGTSESEREKFETYGRMFLMPDQQQVFHNKAQLKKRETSLFSLTSGVIISIAAAILLILLFVPLKQLFIPDSLDNGVIEKGLSLEPEKITTPESGHLSSLETATGRLADIPETEMKTDRDQAHPQRSDHDNMILSGKKPIAVQREPSIDYLAVAAVPDLHVEHDPALTSIQPVMPLYLNDNYLTIGEWVSYKIKSGLLREKGSKPGDPVTAGDFLDMGIKGVNAITGWNIQTEQLKDSVSGQVTFLAVTSQLFGYSRSREK